MTREIPRYSAKIFWSDEDGCYVAACSEIPGLSGLGKSREEAITELSTVLALAMETFAEEGKPPPPAWARHAASGQFRLRLPRSLHAQLVDRAELEGVSLNTLVVTLLAQGMGREEPTAAGQHPDYVA
jgi:antitoxin HicB